MAPEAFLPFKTDTPGAANRFAARRLGLDSHCWDGARTVIGDQLSGRGQASAKIA